MSTLCLGRRSSLRQMWPQPAWVYHPAVYRRVAVGPPCMAAHGVGVLYSPSPCELESPGRLDWHGGGGGLSLSKCHWTSGVYGTQYALVLMLLHWSAPSFGRRVCLFIIFHCGHGQLSMMPCRRQSTRNRCERCGGVYSKQGAKHEMMKWDVATQRQSAEQEQ